jgi:hypothetical protein
VTAPAKIVAAALHRRVRATTEAAPPARTTSRASVLNVSPLRLDLHGSALVLDADDVEFGREVARYVADEGLSRGDVLVLTEVDEGDWIAVAVVPAAG